MRRQEAGARGRGTGEHHDERGFALLVIFLMAGAVALMLYKQMPRVAFESERDKEQLLIDRGDQYKRAIQMYLLTMKRYPARIEDLENTNDKRFLRRRFIDPFTGKDEWRLIHTNGQLLTDSKVHPMPSPASGQGSGSNSSQTASNAPSTATPGNADPNAPPAVNAAVAARPSDRTLPGNQTFTASAPSTPPSNSVGNYPANYNDPASFPPISLFPNGYNAPAQGQPALQPGRGVNQPGVIQPGVNQPPNVNQPGLPGVPQPFPGQLGFGQPGQIGIQPGTLPPGILPPGVGPGIGQPGIIQPGVTQPGVQLGAIQPGAIQPGAVQQGLAQQGLIPSQQIQQTPPFPGQQLPVQQPGQPPFPGTPGNPVDPSANPFGGMGPPPTPVMPGAAGGANPALGIINNLLTTPRQPPAGLGTPAPNNATVGGGIAGVASTYTGPAIKTYGDRTDYSEWEFVYTPQQQGVLTPVPPGQTPASGGTPNAPGANAPVPTAAGTPNPGLGLPPAVGPGPGPQR